MSHRGAAAALLSLAVAVPLLASACGSGNGGAISPKAQLHNVVCPQLLAVFSDGPDPTTDPVGYALSQLRPLGQVHTADSALTSALDKLITTDHAIVDAKATSVATTAATNRAYTAVDKACPGVTP